MRKLPLILLTLGYFGWGCSHSRPPVRPVLRASMEGDYETGCRLFARFDSFPSSRSPERTRLLALAGRCAALGFGVPMPEGEQERLVVRAHATVPGSGVTKNIQAARRAVALNPSVPNRWHLARLLMMAHRWREALDVLASLPPSTPHILAMARCRIELGDRKGALVALDALGRLATKRHASAAAYLHKVARASRPQPPDLARELARAARYMAMNAYPAARQILGELAKKYPTYPDPLYYLALLDLGQGRLVDALVLLEKARRMAPEDADVLALLGRVEAMSRNFRDAVADLRRAVRIAPFELAYHEDLLDACVGAKDPACELEALRLMDQRFGPMLTARKRLRYAILLEDTGEERRAMALYEQLSEVPSPFVSSEALIGKARILVKWALRGDGAARKKAMELLPRLRKKFPLDHRPAFLLKKLKGSSGDRHLR